MKIKRNNYSLLMISLGVVLMIAIVLAVCVGKYEVSPSESISIIFNALFHREQTVNEMAVNVVLGLRLPRVLAAILVGSALSLSGAAYQGIYRNPLISPDFLGVSSGAAIGAAIGILLSLSSSTISLFAFAVSYSSNSNSFSYSWLYCFVFFLILFSFF